MRAPARAVSAVIVAIAIAVGIGAGASVASASARAAAAGYRVERRCGQPRPRAASCAAMRLVAVSLTPAELRAHVVEQAGEEASGESPAAIDSSPLPGYLTPQGLRAAYSLPSETASAATQTIAVVDAFDDPAVEADLGVYDEQFGLPACTSANGCFTKLNEQGQPSPLPSEPAMRFCLLSMARVRMCASSLA